MNIPALWESMTAIYGHRWTSSYGTGDELTHGIWAAGLDGCTDMHLQRGIRECITSGDAWPPSLPEFRAMCLGLPSRAEAVRAAVSGDIRHPVIEAMCATLTSWERQHMSAAEMRTYMRDVYDQACRETTGRLLQMTRDVRSLKAANG